MSGFSKRTCTVMASFTLVAMVIGFSACQNGQSERPSEPSKSQHEPRIQDEPIVKDAHDATDEAHGLHVIRSNQLQKIMQDLRSLDFERLTREAEHGSIDADRVRIAEHAASLADDARLIPRLFRDMELSDESQRVFDKLSMQLAEQCNELATLVRRNDFRGVKKKVEEIVTTCNACHTSFRGPTLAMATPTAR